MLALHEGIHIFDRPRTFVIEANQSKLAFAGFPYCREGVRSEFRGLLDATGWDEHSADMKLLCVHHCFEGATVGAHNFTFRQGKDVIRMCDVPKQFDAVLTGHVHRAQVLREDLRGRPVDAPVIYPGSIERTAFAERDEEKGFYLLALHRNPTTAAVVVDTEFQKLPARPMVVEEISVDRISGAELSGRLATLLGRLPPHAVVQIRIRGTAQVDARQVLSAAYMRTLAPATMNVELVMSDGRNPR